MKIQITQTLSNGQVTQQVVTHEGAQAVKVQALPNSKISFNLEPTGGKNSDVSKVKSTDIKRLGNNLILESEGEALVEVVDFYEVTGASLGDVAWNYTAPDLAAVAATPEALALAGAQSSGLVAGVPVWMGLVGGAVAVAAAGGSSNTAEQTVQTDRTPPTLTITDSVSAATATGPVEYTFTFSEAVSGFDVSKISITGGTAGAFTKVNDTTYTLVVTPTANATGNISVSLETTGVTDLANNAMVQTTGLTSTQAFDTTTPVVDTTAPTLVITDDVSAATATGPVQYTFTFSEAVSGFDVSKVSVTGGTAGTFTKINDTTYTLVVTPAANATGNIVVTASTTGVIDLSSNAMVQTAGLSSTQAYDTTTPVVPSTAPTVVISDNVSATTATGPVLYTFTFSEAVSGFDVSKVSVTGGTAGAFTKINDTTYTLVVTPAANATGNIVVTASTTGVVDLSNNAMVQTTGLSSTQAYDTTAPTVVITDSVSATTATGLVQYTFTFSEAVSGFDIGKLTVTGGTAGTFTAVNDHTYTVVVTPTAGTTGNISVSLSTVGVSDLSGNAMVQSTGLTSTQAYDTSTPVVDTTAPTLTITDNATAATVTGPVQYTFTFSEPVSDFDVSKISVAGGVIGTLTPVSSTVYQLVVTPTNNTTGNITVSVAAATVHDLANNALAATTSATARAYDTTSTLWSVTALTGSVSEDAGTLSYVITRTGNGAAASIDFSTGGGTATAGSDYTAVSQTVSFAAGELSKTIQVALTNDTAAESNETVSASISNASVGSITTGTANATILDNDQSIWSVGVSPTSVDESAGFVTYTVSRTGATGAATIAFATGGGTATAGSDFTAVSQTLSFAAGEMSKTVQVAITDDTESEPQESLAAAISNASQGSIAVNMVTATILDNDHSVWSIATSTPSLDEGTGFITYTVSRAGTSTAATVDFVTGGGTATAGSDYTAVSQTLTFAAGEMSKTVQVAITDDTVAEANETVAATISNVSQGSEDATFATSTATATILDNDQSVWSVGTNTATLDEGAGYITYTVSRTGATNAATLDFATGGGTATPGSDYTAVSQTLSFAAGEMSKTVQVAITDDVVIESNETVFATIGNVSAGSINTASVSATITDNDQAVWSVAASTGTVSEGTGQIFFTVSRTGTTSAATIDFSTGSVGGITSASAGLDYTAVSQTLTFAAGEMSKTVAVTLLDDILPEPSENVLGIITNASMGAIATGSASTTITDNEQASWVVAANTATVDEGAGYISYSVTRSGLTNTAATIDFVTAGGAATAGSDYTAQSQTLSFAAGETSKTVLVAITDDTNVEGDETVTAIITGASQGDITTASATGTITDNEVTVWSVSSPNTTVNEGAGYALYTVSRTGPLTAGTIDFAAKGITSVLSQPATEGVDFTTTALTLSFAAGEASQTVRVPLIDDNVSEMQEGLAGQIGNASVGVVGTASATVIVADDEQSFWSVGNIGNVFEGAGTVALTVVRSGASGAATVDFVLSGTATNGVDYTAPASQTLTFAAGEMSKTVLVNVTNDTTPELSETITGTLTNVSQGTVVDSPRGATIVDDDSTAWAVAQTSATEGGTLVYTVTRTGDTSTAATIDFATSGGTAVAGIDYTTVNQTLSFAAGETRKTVLVATTSDTLAEANETVIGTLISASSGTISTGAVSATISDDDQSLWTVAVATSGLESNGYALFTITRTGSLGGATIDFNTSGSPNQVQANTAIAGLDYVSLSQTLTFAEGETTKTVQVTVLNDNLLEQTEGFLGNITHASTGSIITSAANGLIVDDDATAMFSVSAESATVEGGLLLVRVIRANSDQAATVDLISTGTGTATPGVDYVFATQTLSFAPGELLKVIAVSTVDDTLPEAAETITFGLTNPSAGAFINGATASVTISDNDGLVSWSIAAASTTVDEGAGYATFTVSRDIGTAAATIDVATIGGTAWAGATNDYDAMAQSLSFAVGEFSKTVRVALREDSLLEGNETVIVGLSNASAGQISTASATVTMVDNDLSIWSVAGTGNTNEGSGAELLFTISRTGDLSAATIDVASMTNGRSVAGIDYTAVRQTLSFGVGEASKVVGIPIIDDSKPESAESISLSIGNQSSGRITTAVATASINSSDETRTTFYATGATAVDDVGGALFTLIRGGDITGTDTLSYSVSGTGGATAGTDFVATSGTVTFLPGVRTIYINVPLIADSVVDAGKGLSIALQNASSGAITPSATLSLTDNDAAASGANTYVVAATANNVYESAGTAEFTITRSGDLSIASTSYFRANSGTATSGTDYTALTSTTLNWAVGEITKVVSVALLDDALAEASKTIIGQNATDAGFSTGVTAGTLNLLDEDTPGSGTNAYAITGSNGVIESNGTMTFTITRSGDLTIASTSYFRTNGGTAATDGSDYTVINSQTLNWAPSETTKVVFVTLTNDTTSEANETVIGQSATDAGFTTGTASATAAITDDDLWTATAGVADTFSYGIASGDYTGTMMVNSGDLADTVSIINTFGSGVGVINLGSDNDRLNVGLPTNFLGLLRTDGGSGVDTLAYSGTTAFNHHLQSVDSFVTGFEIIDLATAATNQTVGLSLADVLEMTRGNAVADTLRIMGNAVSGDVLNLQVADKTLATPAAGSSITDVDGTSYVVSASAAGNASASDVTIGGKTYDVYQYAFDSHTLNLLVHTTITTNVI